VLPLLLKVLFDNQLWLDCFSAEERPGDALPGAQATLAIKNRDPQAMTPQSARRAPQSARRALNSGTRHSAPE
jgi:hypothetical protein